MAGHMNLLNPFVFNQFSPYGAYAQVSPLPHPRGNHPPKYKAASLSSGIAATATGRSDGRRCHGTRIRSRLHEPDGGSGNADTSWPKRHRPAPLAAVADHAQLQHGRQHAQRTARRSGRRCCCGGCRGRRLHERHSTNGIPRT